MTDKQRIAWLEKANKFHKDIAEEAIQEQWRLQKKVWELENDYMSIQEQLQTTQFKKMV